jgi:DNA (cytosine-5)-methyltransferase 1
LHNYQWGKKNILKIANQYLKEIIEYKNEEEKLNILQESALYTTFEVENVPFLPRKIIN